DDLKLTPRLRFMQNLLGREQPLLPLAPLPPPAARRGGRLYRRRGDAFAAFAHSGVPSSAGQAANKANDVLRLPGGDERDDGERVSGVRMRVISPSSPS